MRIIMTVVYFSPTNTSKKTILEMAGGYGGEFHELDLCRCDDQGIDLRGEDIVFLSVPVYYGRVPALAAERIRCLKGDKTPVVTVVVYGNRHYDDALLELNDLCRKQGFQVIASGAYIGEHCLNPDIAAGRPNAEDLKHARDFAAQIAAGGTIRASEMTVPGNKPYRKYSKMKFHPAGNRNCTNCGICAELCPSGAIDKSKGRKTDPELCISCMRCVNVCPQNARALKLNFIMRPIMMKAIYKMCTKERREPEIFFSRVM